MPLRFRFLTFPLSPTALAMAARSDSLRRIPTSRPTTSSPPSTALTNFEAVA